MENDWFGPLLGLIAGVYFSIASVMTFYFWYLYAQDESFVATLFIGPLVGIFKGLFWIFFI